jgi:hypothetical protein
MFSSFHSILTFPTVSSLVTSASPAPAGAGAARVEEDCCCYIYVGCTTHAYLATPMSCGYGKPYGMGLTPLVIHLPSA